MGGRGSGGARVNTGPKPMDEATLALRGSRPRRKPVLAVSRPANLPQQAPERVNCPEDLPIDQKAVWDALAPEAMAQRTLTSATASAFRDLCEAIVIKRLMLAQIQTDGMTLVDVSVDGAGVEHQSLRAHPLLAKHQGMMVRVESGMARFLLTATGKPSVEQAAPVDEFAEFDGPQLVKGA